ncbi:unnamed protein product [Symbiodinium sp. KB8]|nr:unnamed protein product [Symbiodinium sp. KB8]
MVPFELADWARDFSTPAMPAPACDSVDPPSYWPAFMSFAFWPAFETIARLNDQVQRCATGKRVGVWDSRYASHEIASRKVQALLSGKSGARVVLAFRDPLRYVLSSFNRMSPDSPGGRSFIEAAREEDVDPDPYGLRLWKGNFSILSRRLMDKVGPGAVWLQPFDTMLSSGETRQRLLHAVGSRARLEIPMPHENRGPPSRRVDPCNLRPEELEALDVLEASYAQEFVRLRRLLRSLDQEIPTAIAADRSPSYCDRFRVDGDDMQGGDA